MGDFTYYRGECDGTRRSQAGGLRQPPSVVLRCLVFWFLAFVVLCPQLAWLGWDAISSPRLDVARTRVLRCRIPVSERRCLDGAHGSTGLAQNGQLMSHVECYFRS